MNINKILILISVFLISFQSYSCSKKDSNPVKDEETTGVIYADNSNIQYIGRFDRSNPKIAVFDWPGVYIQAKFEGTSCAIRLIDGKNYYDVFIDNQSPQVLKTYNDTVYQVAANLKDTVHSIIIEKRTEANIGKGEFLGFILDEGRQLVLLDSIPARRIEFIGNSITCGYGVEGESASSPFKPETENAALSFAALVGKALNADYAMVAYSGKGVVRNYGDPKKSSIDPMPSLYDRTICFDSTLKWDFKSWIPQVVVINLGTNDFSTLPYPDKSVFEDAYVQLINRVQSNYPGVAIFCVCGPLIGEPCGTYINEVVNQCQQNNSNKKVYYINVSTSVLTLSDRGADWHPNIMGQQKTSDVILPVIISKMGW